MSHEHVPPPHDAWQARYAQLLAERGARSPSPGIPLEDIAALAEGRYAGQDRLSLLERILAHPDTARELQVLRALAAQATGDAPMPNEPAPRVPAGTSASHDVAGARSASRPWRVPAWLGMAAALVILVVGTRVWRTGGTGSRGGTGGGTGGGGAGDSAMDVVRGAATVAITHPTSGAALSPGDTVRWSSSAAAVGYRVELVAPDGMLVVQRSTADTSWVIPDSVTLVASQRYQLLLTRILADGREERTAPVSVAGRAR